MPDRSVAARARPGNQGRQPILLAALDTGGGLGNDDGMPRFAANLSMLFTERPFLERFAQAAEAGFRGVEFLFPYDYPPETVARALGDAGLENVLFNLPPGDLSAGERGLAALPGREADFEASLETALEYALALGTPRLHVMSGVVPENAERTQYRATYVDNLKKAAAVFAPHGIDALVEPLNPRDVPGYLVARQDEALAILDAVAVQNARLQMDFYHCQMVEGELAESLGRNFDRIGHVQIAGVPGRHEPAIGEINYPYLFELLDELGYAGWVGCEYRPVGDTLAGLAWAAAYGIGPIT